MIFYKFFVSLGYFLLYPFLILIFRKHGYRQRMSFRNVSIDRSIWIHVPSLMEVNAVKPLIKRLFESCNKNTILLTCMTTEGATAAKEISGKLYVHPFPLDVPSVMNKAFKVFDPTLIIMMETDIYPCLLNQAFKNKVPVLLINAKLTQKSYKKYRFLRWFLRKEFSAIKLICTQSENDENKYKQLKFPNVVYTSNLKFSIDSPEYENHVLRHAWDYQFNDFVLAFVSTKPDEEQLIKEIYYELNPLIQRLKIIIVPRQFQRMSEFLAIFDTDEYALFSELDKGKPFLIMDEEGMLTQIYALCDVAIICGSFYDAGGDNFLEAFWYEKPVIIGKFHQAYSTAVEKFMSENAIIVSSPEELSNDIHILYKDSEHRANIGKRAKDILLENKDALNNHWEEITKWLE